MGWGWLRDAASIAFPLYGAQRYIAEAAGRKAGDWLGDLFNIPDVPQAQNDPATQIDPFDVTAAGFRAKTFIEQNAQAGYRSSFLIGPRGTEGEPWKNKPIDYAGLPLWSWLQRGGTLPTQPGPHRRRWVPPEGSEPDPNMPPILDPGSPEYNPYLPQRKREDLDPFSERRTRTRTINPWGNP